jgi:hypothetical protein
MNEAIKHKVLKAYTELPDGMEHPPAKPERLNRFEEVFGPIPDEYRWYLLECGGGIVGSEWVDSIDELFVSQSSSVMSLASHGGGQCVTY